MSVGRTRSPRQNADNAQLEALVEATMREAGVAEAVEAYEKAEAAYALAAGTGMPAEFAAASTEETGAHGVE